MSFTIHECQGCGHAVYPARLLCPGCHRSDWRSLPVRFATLRQFTHLPGAPGGGAWLATLQTDAGPLVVARLAQAPEATSQRFTLRLERDALIAEPDSTAP